MKPRCLAIALFFNDDDIVVDHIGHMLSNGHDVVVFDHGSTDRTADLVSAFGKSIRAYHFIPRSFPFQRIFEHVSRYVIEHYVPQYDFVSFPESDERLCGPDRTKSYYEYCCEVWESEYDWVQFDNFIFHFTSADDIFVPSPYNRIKHYALWETCPPRIYAWKAKAMNIRLWNHNPALGEKFPINFVTQHYQFRSLDQMEKRIVNRMGLRRGVENFHFDFHASHKNLLIIDPSLLNVEDGGELSRVSKVNWQEIYGSYRQVMEELGHI